MPPLPDQQVINLLATPGAIALTGGAQPTFAVQLQKVRDVLKAEQDALTVPPAGAALPQERRITGTLPQPPTNPTTNIPVIILIGRNGSKIQAGGLPADGQTVILLEPNRNGHILIAAGGYGDGTQALVGTVSNGGSALLIASNDSLLIALGGHGGDGTVTSGTMGGEGGLALASGRDGNDVYVQGGNGAIGGSGTTGTPGKVGSLLGFIPATAGGPGGVGGKGGGGKAYALSGQGSFAQALGGTGGIAGVGGPGGAPAPAGLGALFGITSAAGGAAGVVGAGGSGGNIKVVVGPNSVEGASAIGAGGAGTPTGANGIREP